MTRSREGSHFHVPDREDFSISEEDIWIRNLGSFTEGDFGSCFLSEYTTSRDVIGMDMRVEDIAEGESELGEESYISLTWSRTGSMMIACFVSLSATI